MGADLPSTEVRRGRVRVAVVSLLVLNVAGFMLFDGVRALVTGDYVRPDSGEYAGQLGPWSHLVEAVGIDPLSTFMKCVFVAWGLAGLGLLARWWWRPCRAALMAWCAATLWYLVPGTACCLAALVVLATMRPRAENAPA